MFAGLLKRVAPFFITFAVGLFIASFFVSIAAPRFGFRRYREMRQCQEIQNLRYENQQLRQELLNQQMRTVEVRKIPANIEDLVPPPPPVALKRVR